MKKAGTILGFSIISVIVIVLLFFVFEQSQYRGQILRNSQVLNYDVSGLEREEFEDVITKLEEERLGYELEIRYRNKSLELSNEDAPEQISSEEVWSTFMDRKEGSVVQNIYYWLQSFVVTHNVLPDYATNNQLLFEKVSKWVKEVETPSVFNGDLLLQNSRVLVRYPKAGERIDEEELKVQVKEAFVNKDTDFLYTPVILQEPQRKDDVFVRLKNEIESYIGEGVVLVNKETNKLLSISDNELAQTISIKVPEQPTENPSYVINELAFASLLQPFSVKEASFSITEEDELELEESSVGLDIDIAKTIRLIQQRNGGETRVPVVVRSVIVPTLSTNDAVSLNISTLVSSFTTYHECCKNRVDNIQKVADMIDGVIVLPGETFSLNTFLGERTEDKGFKPAGTIIKGQIEDTVGGGISQFTTTLHNAVYWAGYRIAQYKPHSIYFNRYPEGIEATINWPYLDYAFQNDSDAGVLIDTQYTDSSITVRLFSSENIQQRIGEQRYGSTIINNPGIDKDKRSVVSLVSERYGFEAPDIDYVANSNLKRGEDLITDYGDQKWKVNVDRTIYEKGEVYNKNFWIVPYKKDDLIMERHPCDIPSYDEDSLLCNE